MEVVQEVKEKSNYMYKMRNMLIKVAPLIGLITVVVAFAIITKGKSISSMNLKILMNTVLMSAIAATGAVFTYSCGAIDMSLGGAICLSAICGSLAGIKTESFAVLIIVTVITSLVISIIKGVAAAYLTLPVFIVTFILGTLLSSIGLVLLGNQTTMSLRSLVDLENVTGINIIMLVGFYLFALIIFNYTKIGKEMKLQGGNALASGQSGINSKRVLITAFLINGLGVALAAIISIMRTKTVTFSIGGSISSDLIIAIVLGGMPISGGPKSRISAAIIGATTITVLNNGLSICNVSNDDIQIVRGIVFLIVVFITSMTYRTKLLPR